MKKLAVMAFPVLRAEEAADLAGVPSGFATELVHALDETHAFVIRPAVHRSLSENPPFAPRPDSADNADLVTRTAEMLDAQFIVSGIIADMGYTMVQDHTPWNIVYEVFDLPPVKRRFRADLFIHDGFSGVLLDRLHYEDMVVGTDVHFSGGISFDSAAFLASSYGKLIRNIITRQAADIRRRLDCEPFEEKIVRIEGQEVYIAAGSESLIRVGDSFVVYHRPGQGGSGIFGKDRLLGHAEHPAAILAIRQVQPRFAMGTLNIPVQGFSTEDIVRSR